MVILAVVALICLVTSVLLVIFAVNWYQTNMQTVTNPSGTPTATITATTRPTETAPLTPVPTIAISNTKINSIYLCKYQNQDMLYMRNGTGRYTIMQLKDYETVNEGEVNSLTNCKLVYEGKSKEEIYINNFDLTSDGGLLLFGFVYDSTNDYSYPNVAVLMKYNAVTGSSHVLFSHIMLGDALNTDPFKLYNGSINVEEILADKYLVFWLGDCYACGSSTTNYFVLNIENNNYIPLMSSIGAFSVDVAANTISYREMVVTGTYPDCADDCNIYEPIGTEHTTTLP